MATWADVNKWLSNVWDKVSTAGSQLVTNLSNAGSKAVNSSTSSSTSSPSTPGTTPPPSSGGTGGTSTGSPSGGGSPSGANSFQGAVGFLNNLTKEETWTRVGIIIVGILLVFIATMLMLKPENPITQFMREIGA